MTDTDQRIVERLIAALATRDRDALLRILSSGVRLRALLPRRAVDLVGADEVAAEMLGWSAEEAEIVPVTTCVDVVGDVLYAGYRFRIGEATVEQHAYCTVEGGAITALRLICSGTRPTARRLDALGDSCATLTPRIAGALNGLVAGDVLAVLTDDPSAPDGIGAWSRLTGHRVVGTATEAGGTRYYLRHA